VQKYLGDDFQLNQVSCQHLFRSGGGMHPLHPESDYTVGGPGAIFTGGPIWRHSWRHRM